MEELLQRLATKCSATDIKILCMKHQYDINLVKHLCEYITPDNPAAFNIVWLCKSIISMNNREIGTGLSGKLISQILNLDNTLSELHLLQMSQYITLNDYTLTVWEDFLTHCKQSQNKFVLAYYFNGFIPLAKLNPILIVEYTQICEHEMERVSSAGKARIRAILKELEKIKMGH